MITSTLSVGQILSVAIESPPIDIIPPKLFAFRHSHRNFTTLKRDSGRTWPIIRDPNYFAEFLARYDLESGSKTNVCGLFLLVILKHKVIEPEFQLMNLQEFSHITLAARKIHVEVGKAHFDCNAI